MALEKFSGSVKKFGKNKEIKNKRRKIIKNPVISFDEKKGWNGILSEFEVNPEGFDDPVSWRKIRWRTTKIRIINGKIKWKEKNRVKVGLSTEKPPQIHSTNVIPMYGIADTKLVITVAPQKDICPQGRTYPTKAVIIEINRMKIPDNHVGVRKNELK